jgi:hypothetical protein
MPLGESRCHRGRERPHDLGRPKSWSSRRLLQTPASQRTAFEGCFLGSLSATYTYRRLPGKSSPGKAVLSQGPARHGRLRPVLRLIQNQ